jgi:hypothetical protein
MVVQGSGPGKVLPAGEQHFYFERTPEVLQ